MGVLLGILIAFYLVFTQSVWVFGWLFGFIAAVPYDREVSFGAAAVVAGLVAGWMAHRYYVSEWLVGILAGLVPVVAVVIGTTFIAELTRMLRETSPPEYALYVGVAALAIVASRLGALARAKVRERPR